MNKKLGKIFGFAVLFAALIGAVVLVRQVQETRRGAAGDRLPVTFSPSGGDYSVGDEIITYIHLGQPEGKLVSTFVLGVSYPVGVLELMTASARDAVADREALSISTLSESDGVITIVGGVKELADDPSSESAIRAVKLTFKVVSENRAKVSLLTEKSELVVCAPQEGGCQPGTEAVLVDFIVSPAVYNSGGGAGPTINLSLDPAQGEKKRNEPFSVNFYADSGDNKISAGEVIFSFDPQKLEVVDVEVPTGADKTFDSFELPNVESGKVRVVGLASRSTNSLKSGRFLFATFTLRIKTLGAVAFTLDKADFSGKTPTGDYLEGELILPSRLVGSYIGSDRVPTQPPGAGSPQVLLKLSFDGVNYKIDDQKVLVKLKKPGFEKVYRDVVVKSDDKGVLSANINLEGVVLGGGYSFIVKGPKHLAERYCVDGQKSRCLSGQSLALKEANQFDFTGWPMEAGDIPDENGVQDGMIEVKDFSSLKRALLSQDESLRKRANLDFNEGSTGKSIINGRDISLYLSTMGHRFDEDY